MDVHSICNDAVLFDVWFIELFTRFIFTQENSHITAVPEIAIVLKPSLNFDFWGLPIYNVMGAAGLFFAIGVFLPKEKGLTAEGAERLHYSFIIALVMAMVSARCANWLLFPEVGQYPFLRRLAGAGFTFYPGLFAFLLVSAIMLRCMRLPVSHWLNAATPSILIFHAFGRIGCSLAGCCYGKILSPPFHLFFWDLTMFPARELEAVSLFLLFFLFEFRIKRGRLPLYLLFYAVLRFFLEFGRGDERGFLFTDLLSPSQIMSLAVIACVTGVLFSEKSGPPSPTETPAPGRR
jgi:phosphatidylglycerol:prolipoprotein diacylglycerol transferase